MQLKAGYKLTDVGVIPEEWQVSQVGREFDIQLGKMLDAEKNQGIPKPYLGNKAVQWRQINIKNLPTMLMSPSDCKRFRLRRGDLLVCEGGEIGRAAIWEAPLEECYYQKALHRLRPLYGFNPYLMLAYLRYWTSHDMLANYVSQTSIAHLTKEKLAKVPIPVPNQEEQQAIVSALNDVDALISALDKLIAKKYDIKQATMQQILTGKRRLPGFEGEWEVKRLGEIANITMGQSPSSLFYNNSANGLPLVQGNADIRKRKTIIRTYTSQITKRCSQGDIILSVRAPVGEVAKADFDACIGRGVCAISYPEPFLYHYLIFFEPKWAKLSKGSTFDSVNSDEVKALAIPLPPLFEQRAIATILSDMDAEMLALEGRREKTRLLKQGMMQELLTGKTRLV